MNARIFVAIGLTAAAWAGAHETGRWEDRDDRDRWPSRMVVEARPEHRDFEWARFHREQERREAWRHEEWRRDRFEHRHPTPVVVVEECHRPQPERVVVYDPQPIRGTLSINW